MLILIIWGVLGLMLYFVEPEMVKDLLVPGLYLPFFILFLPASALTLAVILGNSRRGFILALGISALLILKVYRLDNWLNFFLVGGIVVTVDRYLSA